MQLDRKKLLATAKIIAEKLKSQSKGTRLRIRMPSRVSKTDTDGWRVVIGDIGKNKPRLEVWLDRFSGCPERVFYACFYSKERQQIFIFTKRVSRKLWPVRIVKHNDQTQGKYVFLTKKLNNSEFNSPILEKYDEGRTFYGVYNSTRRTSKEENPYFVSRAVSFFEDVVRTFPNVSAEDEQREVYPEFENRKIVISHVQRERSKLLATECKIRDNYVCQVCGFRFEDFYGKMGVEFAEAHHRIPLSQLRGQVKTRIEDLVTVCANCHRMLHKMQGKRQDITELKIIISKRQSKRSKLT